MAVPGLSVVWLHCWKPGWDGASRLEAELEAEKALEFGHAWEFVKT